MATTAADIMDTLLISMATSGRQPAPAVHSGLTSFLGAVTKGLPLVAKDLFVDYFINSGPMEPWREVAFQTILARSHDGISPGLIEDSMVPCFDKHTHHVVDVLTPMELSDHPIVPQLRA